MKKELKLKQDADEKEDDAVQSTKQAKNAEIFAKLEDQQAKAKLKEIEREKNIQKQRIQKEYESNLKSANRKYNINMNSINK